MSPSKDEIGAFPTSFKVYINDLIDCLNQEDNGTDQLRGMQGCLFTLC